MAACVYIRAPLSSMPAISSVDSLIIMFAYHLRCAKAQQCCKPFGSCTLSLLKKDNVCICKESVIQLGWEKLGCAFLFLRSFQTALFGDISQASLLFGFTSPVSFCAVTTECNEDGMRIRKGDHRPGKEWPAPSWWGGSSWSTLSYLTHWGQQSQSDWPPVRYTACFQFTSTVGTTSLHSPQR